MNTGVWSQAGESPAYAVSHQGQIASPQGGSEWQYDLNTGQWYLPSAMPQGVQATANGTFPVRPQISPVQQLYAEFLPGVGEEPIEELNNEALYKKWSEASAGQVALCVGGGLVLLLSAWAVIFGVAGFEFWSSRTPLERTFKMTPNIVIAVASLTFGLGCVFSRVPLIRSVLMVLFSIASLAIIPAFVVAGFSRTLAGFF